MNHIFNTLVEQNLSQLEDSPLKSLLSSSLEKRRGPIEDLLQAKEQHMLNQEEFEIELEREKKILEAEMLTTQIAAKSAIQKVINNAIESLSKGLI